MARCFSFVAAGASGLVVSGTPILCKKSTSPILQVRIWVKMELSGLCSPHAGAEPFCPVVAEWPLMCCAPRLSTCLPISPAVFSWCCGCLLHFLALPPPILPPSPFSLGRGVQPSLCQRIPEGPVAMIKFGCTSSG